MTYNPEAGGTETTANPNVMRPLLDIPGDLREELQARLVEGAELDIAEDTMSKESAEIYRSPELRPELAHLAVNNALYFINAVSHNPGIKLTPSKMVDEAWHAFLLFTEDYAKYCADIGGDFVHHRPNRRGEEPDPDVLSTKQTYEFIKEQGFSASPLAWGISGTGNCCGAH